MMTAAVSAVPASRAVSAVRADWSAARALEAPDQSLTKRPRRHHRRGKARPRPRSNWLSLAPPGCCCCWPKEQAQVRWRAGSERLWARTIIGGFYEELQKIGAFHFETARLTAIHASNALNLYARCTSVRGPRLITSATPRNANAGRRALVKVFAATKCAHSPKADLVDALLADMQFG